MHKDNKKTKEQIQDSQSKQKIYYDKSAKDLKPLEEGEVVRLQPFTKGKDLWKKGIITKKLDERSYEIQAGGTAYRRNRLHIKPSGEEPDKTPASSTPTPKMHYMPSGVVENRVEPASPEITSKDSAVTRKQPSTTVHVPETPKIKSPVKTRSGRISKMPSKYME